MYFTNIPSSARALDSLPPTRKMPSTNFYPPTKQQFSCYNPIKTSCLAVAVALYHFHFNLTYSYTNFGFIDVQYLQNGFFS